MSLGRIVARECYALHRAAQATAAPRLSIGTRAYNTIARAALAAGEPRMPKKTPSAIVAVLAITGCATTPSVEAARVADADEKAVAECRFVGEVQGSSGWGNLAASTGMENSKNEAREKAAKLGATNVVWESVSGGYSPYASGRAYACSRRGQ